MTVIGYVLTGQDNDTFMFEQDDPAVPRCRVCGYKLDFQAFNPNYRLGKRGRSWDIAGTYDGQVIVSRRFRDVCMDNDVAGIEFKAFPQEPDFFQAVSTRVIELDPVASMLRLLKQCPSCQNFESIVGPYRRFRSDGRLPSGFYRSDLVLASGDEKGPLLVASIDVRRLLEDAGLTGLEFSAAEDTR